jgi:hypothetical protein
VLVEEYARWGSLDDHFDTGHVSAAGRLIADVLMYTATFPGTALSADGYPKEQIPLLAAAAVRGVSAALADHLSDQDSPESSGPADRDAMLAAGDSFCDYLRLYLQLEARRATVPKGRRL